MIKRVLTIQRGIESIGNVINDLISNYLRENDYHYHEKARTYCMCGWRNPRFERLIKILSKIDFDSILEKN